MSRFQVPNIANHITGDETIAVHTAYVNAFRFVLSIHFISSESVQCEKEKRKEQITKCWLSRVNVYVLYEMLIYHSICLKCGNWSGVMTLKVVPNNGNETGTDTTVPLSVVAATKRVVVR